MAYPSVSFKPVPQFVGIQPIGNTSTTQQHPLGTIVQAVDSTYGVGEFIYAKGVASTAAGDVVTLDTKAGTTTRGVAGGRGVAAVAMSANVASQYGWYAVSGAVPVNAGTVAAAAPAYLTSTAGQIDDAVVSGDKLDGIIISAAASGGFATCQLSRPAANGNG